MSYWQWKPYVPVAERRRKAAKAAAKAGKAGTRLNPIPAASGAIARTVWGKAWCDNLERYSDYENRLPRGRTYVRNGSVIDLAIGPGTVVAQVVGSDLYRVTVEVKAVPDAHWKAIGTDCAGSIDSMVELLQGRLSKAVMERLCRHGDGLFPAPKEISFDCSCPDWAAMCKHVAAVLYGVGARLDSQPELLFTLRKVDGSELLAQAGTGAGLAPARKSPGKARVLDTAELGDVFGLDMAEAVATPAAPAASMATGATARKTASKKAVAKPAVAKKAPAKQAAAKKAPAKKPAASKTAAKKAPAKKPAASKTAAKKEPTKKAATRMVAPQAPAAVKVAATAVAAKRATGPQTTARKTVKPAAKSIANSAANTAARTRRGKPTTG